eukprot:m.17168 g.17168  ORF g.17168 m.17168 type:complete len:318 (+) comp5925_c0_seq1:360-1313(+)
MLRLCKPYSYSPTWATLVNKRRLTEGPSDLMISNVQEMIFKSQRIVVLSGAGVSTGSGIPDYRSPGRPPYKPLLHSEFMKSAANRKRYWSRSFLGYPFIASREPNMVHNTVADMSKVKHVMTQNVDGLHQKAGSSSVCELHGSLHSVICTDCGLDMPRPELQDILTSLNPSFLQRTKLAQIGHDIDESVKGTLGKKASKLQRPDGDFANEDDYEHFQYPDCPQCSGILKPDVTFFGDNLSQERRDESFEITDSADLLLVLGTTLSTWSSYRLVRRALDNNCDVAIVNRGPTRADKDIPPEAKLEGDLQSILKSLQQS